MAVEASAYSIHVISMPIHPRGGAEGPARRSASRDRSSTDIERALKKAGYPSRVEEHHHPAHWTRHEGPGHCGMADKKEPLIRKVAQKMEVRK